MNTAEKIKSFLALCHEVFPTEGERHNLTYNSLNQTLELTIFYEGKWLSFVPGEKDLDSGRRGIDQLREYIDENS